METKLTNKEIIKFLKKSYNGSGFIDGLKIKYRSLICPFISLINMVEPGDKVGDIGCGSGQFLLLVNQFAKPSFSFGIEISEKLIDNANQLFRKAKSKNFHFQVYDGVYFPKEIGDMDIIFLIDVLHHVPKEQQEIFLNTISNSIKIGARLVLKDINAGSPLVYCNKLHDLIFAGEIGNEMRIEKVIEILKACGLKIIIEDKKTMYVYPHFTIVAKK